MAVGTIGTMLSGNDQAIRPPRSLADGEVLDLAPGPFQLTDGGDVKRVLADAGFVAIDLESVDEPINLGANVDDAFAFVGTMGMVLGHTQDLDGPPDARLSSGLHDALAVYEDKQGSPARVSAWLVTARRP